MVNTRCPAPAAPPTPPPPGQTFAPPPYIQFTNQTLRQIVHTTIGGSKARVVLTNAYGTAPVTIGGAHIALRDQHWWVRFYAATALAELGPAGEEALTSALLDPRPEVHDMARYLLERGDVVPALP